MVKNFTDSAEKELLSLVKQVESEQISNFTDWVGDGWYAFQEKIGTLDISKYLDNVNAYHKKVIDKNNASSDQIRAIFENVRNLDSNYATRFVAYATMIAEFKGLVNHFADVMSPSNGDFNPGSLSNFLSDFEAKEKYLKMIGGDGITQEDLLNMDELTRANFLSGFLSFYFEAFPSLSYAQQVGEIAIGPGVSIYYSATEEINGDSNLNVQLVMDAQVEKIKNIDLKVGDNTIKMSVGSDGEAIELSYLTRKGDFGSTVLLSGNAWGGSIAIGNDTYTTKINMESQKISVEEAVKTEVSGGSITTTVGIKYSSDDSSKWEALPTYVFEEERTAVPTFGLSLEELANYEKVLIDPSAYDLYQIPNPNTSTGNNSAQGILDGLSVGIVVGEIMEILSSAAVLY